MALIRAFMMYGHLEADVDPLQLNQVYGELEVGTKNYKSPDKAMRALIKYETYGFTDQDLDRKFYVDVPEFEGVLKNKKEWTLRELNDTLRQAYCKKIGVEYMHMFRRD